jgi:hypothetical protein
MLYIPEPLITRFRKLQQAFPEHFDHINFLSINCDFPSYHHNSVL